MPYYDQGQTNGCGTTSEAMILTYLLGHPVHQYDIDNQIRQVNSFTSPQDMVRYAQRQGLSAEMYNHGTINELQGYVARGIPCQCMISADNSGSISTLHYVDVVGFGTDTSGRDGVVVHDPANPDGGRSQFIPIAEFQAKWAKPPGGFENFFIAYAPGGTALPPSRKDGIEGTLAGAEGVANVTNGFHRFFAPNTAGEYFHGLVQLPTGIGQTVGGGVLGGIELGSDWIHGKTNGIPVVKNIVGPATAVVSAAAASGSDVVNGAAEGVDDVGQAAQDLIDGNFKAAGSDAKQVVTDVVGGAVDGVKDAGKGLVNAVGDLFSW
ncbi:MAG: C39 family peptidase [Myxococcales bacterium]